MKKFYLMLATAFDIGKLNIQTFNSKYMNYNCNSTNTILTNIVGMLYLMIKNQDFVFIIDHVFRA